ncbi:Flp family type IVb pilin [Sphingomonas aurea]
MSVQAVRRLVARMLSDQRGVSAVEYGLIIAMIVLVMMVGLSSVADVTIGMWGNVSQKVVNAR